LANDVEHYKMWSAASATDRVEFGNDVTVTVISSCVYIVNK